MGRYYISADLEGVVGVSTTGQCYPTDDRAGYIKAVEQLTLEITWIDEALRQIDPDAELVVNDAHNTMTNLAWPDLPPNVILISGKPKRWAMMAGLDATFDAVFFVGYHAKAGTPAGVLNHTFHAQLFDVSVNGVSYGEGSMNALYANLVHQVPVALAAGDQAFIEEIGDFLPRAVTVVTKTGLSTTAARHVSLSALESTYKEAVHRVCSTLSSIKANPVFMPSPFILDITFVDTLCCDIVMTSPLFERVDGRCVRYQDRRFENIYLALQSAYTMLAYAKTLN